MLAISKNQRYLLRDGAFFPYLADTAWTMIQRLNRREIVFYLDKRAQQGFNAIQVAAVSELGGVTEPNREGNLPFADADVLQPNPAYFSLVTFVADACAQRGMALVLLPTWGDKFNQKWGSGPEIFIPDNAAAYGRYLAGIIGKRADVIWMLGGDRPLETPVYRRIMDRMAEGLRAGEAVRHLITYHPCGEASSVDFLPDADYIDYHSVQSSHAFGGFDSQSLVSRTLRASEKPCIDAEYFYEDFPLDFQTEWGYRFTPLDIRRRVYQNLIAGSAGHTYGHQSVWCFHTKANAIYPFDWRSALDRPAARQMRHVNTLLAAVDVTVSHPADLCRNAASREGEGFGLVYAPGAEPLFIDLRGSTALRFMQWFDPVTGDFTASLPVPGRQMTAISPFSHDGVLLLRTEEHYEKHLADL